MKFSKGATIFLLLLLVGVGYSAEPPSPTADWPESVAVGELLILDAPEAAENVAWSVYPHDTVYRVVDLGMSLVIQTKQPGAVIVAIGIGGPDPVTVAVTQAAIVIGDGGPSPGPGPLPPVPVVGKLHVLILYESQAGQPGSLAEPSVDPDTGEAIPGQASILTSVPVLKYLDSHCFVEDGQPEYRFLDDDEGTEHLSPEWQSVIAEGRESSEGKKAWLIIINDAGGYSGELPENVESMLELLERFGGK